MPKHQTPGLPSRQQILDFISAADQPAGKREIARAFGLSGQEKITLKALLKKDKNRCWVIYCEKIWLHGDQLRQFEKAHGKKVRPMLVPFNLK